MPAWEDGDLNPAMRGTREEQVSDLKLPWGPEYQGEGKDMDYG